MNKQDLINRVADQTSLTKKDVETVVNETFLAIRHKMKKEEVKIKGFGTFLSKRKKARNGRNPQTGEAITIPAMTVPKFRASDDLKGYLRQG